MKTAVVEIALSWDPGTESIESNALQRCFETFHETIEKFGMRLEMLLFEPIVDQVATDHLVMLQ